ncbi:hypothetical protein L1049_002005 [Liquidambar formosana]|uniref:Uncharacterized protein n=1 Tax=Liquidambar formosana TaxID=63359 RepID=A0AAP0NGH3_LIQFO
MLITGLFFDRKLINHPLEEWLPIEGRLWSEFVGSDLQLEVTDVSRRFRRRRNDFILAGGNPQLRRRKKLRRSSSASPQKEASSAGEIDDYFKHKNERGKKSHKTEYDLI